MANDSFAIEVRGLHAAYGESRALHGVDINVRASEVVALLGRNGAGRTTTLRSIMGMLDRVDGSVRVAGKEVIGLPSHKIARLGIGYCPEERGIFASLNCMENLLLPPVIRAGGLSLRSTFEFFPNLEQRAKTPGSRLSGGEQQMLALARILRTGSRILLLDEISEGLAPVIVKRLAEIVLKLKDMGYTILLVEQNFRFAAPLADRFYLLESGKVVDSFARDDLPSRTAQLHAALGV